MRIAILQHGDYAEAYNRFKNGGGETYYAQRYSVDFVEKLADQAEFVGICANIGERREEVALKDNLISACMPPKPGGGVHEEAVIDLFTSWRPTHLILRTPARKVLGWALKNNLKILPILADSFGKPSFMSRLRALPLTHKLNDKSITMAANHNVPASLSLAKIGVHPSKIFPWDWPHAHRPQDFRVKSLGTALPKIVSIGVVSKSKGASDCIDAAHLLQQQGVAFHWRIIGAGPYENEAKAKVLSLSLNDRVTLTGLKPHDEVIAELEAATISVVASRHAFPEGLPMTIYETLATRTPLILSDHPMFQMFFNNSDGAIMIPEKSPQAIAAAISRLLADPKAYEFHSEATAALWERIKCDLSWGKLVETWLQDPFAAPERLRAMALPEINI